MGIDHYENFPVASVLMPRRLRYPITVIYRFARSADDFADEGERSDDERLALLNQYRIQLDRIEAGRPVNDRLFIELAAVIKQYALPIQLFRDLLDAFSQDVVKKRYEDFDELLDYCRRSANPVGRLLLHLFGQTSDDKMRMSDAICSSLQLANFWQDVAVDWKKDRIYIPQEDLQRFGISEDQIARGYAGGAWPVLVRFEIERTRRLLLAGAPLGQLLPGRLGLEIRTIIMGGAIILRKVDDNPDVFRHRPVLNAWDWCRMVYRAVMARQEGSNRKKIQEKTQ